MQYVGHTTSNNTIICHVLFDELMVSSSILFDTKFIEPYSKLTFIFNDIKLYYFFIFVFIADDAGQNFLWFIIGACIGLVIAGIGLGCWWKVETFELCQKGKK